MPKELYKDLWKTIKDKESWSGIIENRAKNGASYFVQATIIPILDDKNEIVEFIGTRQDITELKKLQFKEITDSVEQALKVNLHNILKNIPTSSVIIDIDSKIMFSNDIFNIKFSYLNCENIKLDSLFINKTGYISKDSVLDWKDELTTIQENCTQKVLINLFNEENEFYISIKKLDENGYYLVLLFDIDNIPFV